VEVVESFPYLGSLIHCTGDSTLEIKRRVSITRDCMMALDRNIWLSRIFVGTKLRLYNSCILSIFLYGAETWAVTATAAKTFDALDQWCLRRILNIHWTERITNNEVRWRTQQPLLSDAVRSRRLRFFGHICRADPSQDHSRALYVSTTGLPKHWRRPGRPRQTRLRTRMIYSHSIWVWRQLNDVLITKQLDRHSWKRLHRWQAPDDDDDA